MNTGDDRAMHANATPLPLPADPVAAVRPGGPADGLVSRSIRRHFAASLAERRRLLVALWETMRSHPHDRAARARMTRHLRVLADAAARAGAGAVESAARAADRSLPHAADNDARAIEALVDATLDAMAAVSQQDAPSIANRLPMVVLDGPDRERPAWIEEVLAAAGCQIHRAGGPAILPSPAAGHVVVVGESAASEERLGEWRAAIAASRRPARLAVLSEGAGYAQRCRWLQADAVLPANAERPALLGSMESELTALQAPLRCVALLGFDAELPAWTDGMSAAGFLVIAAAEPADLWRMTRDGGLDAIVAGPSVCGRQAIELACALAQDREGARVEILRVRASDDDAAGLLAAGIAPLAADLPPADCARALGERLRRARHELAGDTDPVSGALRRAPFLLLVQAMLDGPAAFVGLGLIDLDGLRALHQHAGRAAGDNALRTIARRLRAALPATAALGRAGTDEFLFAFTARNEAEARRLMAQAASLPADGDGAPRVEHCIGGVLLDRDDRVERVPLVELIARAGELMLDVKSGGGSRIALARYGERPIGERWF